ncbi:MAG: DUF695 domain-containing protein [Myxococcales bacterium]|nr:DUF695 domain-containing protein [Myxococcales bacterium]
MQTLPTFSDNPDSWETYFTTVDDCPASIALDIFVGERAPLESNTNLLAVLIHMNEPGEHGLGDGVDPEALRHVEQQVVHAYEQELSVLFVGRVRSQGVWQLYFYGAESEEVEQRAAQLLSGFSGWKQELHIKSDPQWDLYFDLLFPDRERLQWIQDRKVCEALAEQGDTLVIPRRVDHYAYFATSADRQRFIDASGKEHFEVESVSFDPDEEHMAYTVQLHRTECVELEAIHEAVMNLLVTATEHDGLYDGWETSVVSQEFDPLPN